MLCGVGMMILQTGLALYRFGGTTSLREWVNPLMWIGLGLFFVTGGLIGIVIERLLRGTTGRFRTLLVVVRLVTHAPAIGVTMEALDVCAGFYAMVFVVVESVSRRKRAAHANAGQHEIAGSTRAEVEVSRLVQEDVGAHFGPLSV